MKTYLCTVYEWLYVYHCIEGAEADVLVATLHVDEITAVTKAVTKDQDGSVIHAKPEIRVLTDKPVSEVMELILNCVREPQ